MLCPNCQHPNSATAKFCENCGFKLQTAPDAAREQKPSLSPVSGSASPSLTHLEKLVPKEFAQRLMQSRTGRIEGERRIVTILFCDVKGSTALGEERDPEEILEIMNGAFDSLIEPVYRYEGTLARLMGDAILAFFGAPIGHEDDPERACLAALAMQEKIRQYAAQLKSTHGIDNFNVRVGINTGLVVVGEVGSDLRVEYTAMGDAINLASRMEQSAEPGSIVIAENTARLARYAIELEPLGALTIKGKAEPVNAYRVLGKKSVPESRRGIAGLTSPLVGRAAEYAALQAAMQQLLHGQGQISFVIGEAGLGKSRLIAELKKQFATGVETVDPLAPVQWLEAHSLSYQTQTPYAPFVDMFTQLFELAPDADDAAAFTQLKQKLHALLGEEGLEVAPFLATVLGITLHGSDLERVRYLMPPFLMGRVMQATARLFETLATTKPTVIVFEDLHWADSTSLQLLSALLPLTQSVPLYMLFLMRPNTTDPAWTFLGQVTAQFGESVTRVELQPLDEHASRELVANLLEIEDLPESVRQLILKKAEGNPFYVEEVIRSLLDQKLVVREGDHWRATREIVNIAIPDTLAGVITARLDRLDEESRHTAQTASVLGREFEYAPLTELADSQARLEPALDVLQARELVRAKRDTALRAYLFKHALTQETAYGSLLLSKRRALHKRAAAYLEAHEDDRVNEIARHWLDANENERALPFVLKAADRAAHAYATTEAIAYYTRALELARQLNDVPSLRHAYEGLGGALSLTPELERAVGVFQEMFAAGQAYNDALMQISALNKQANLRALRMGQMEQAEPLLLQAEALAHEHSDKMGLGEMYVIRCQISVGSADFDTAMQYIGESVKVGQDLELKEQTAWGLTHLSTTYTFMTRFEQAWQVSEQAWDLAIEIGNREFQAGVLTTQGLIHWRNGDLDAAIRAGEFAAEISERIGYTLEHVLGRWGAGWGYWQKGEYSAAISNLQEARRVADPFTSFMPFLTVISEATLGIAMIDSETDINEALAIHRHALELSESPVGGMANGSAWSEIAGCALNLGNTELAQSLYQRALVHPSFFRQMLKPYNLLGLARIARQGLEFDAAQRYIDQARDIADATSIRPIQAAVALEQGLLLAARGDHSEAVLAFADAELRAQSMNLRPLVLEAQIGTAASLDALGRADQAALARNQAHETASNIANFISDVESRRSYLDAKLARIKRPAA